MVCAKCEKKLAKNAPSAPDPWKAGSSNSAPGKESRKLNENKLLSKKTRYTPYGVTDFKCTACKSRLNKEGLYCHMCAYQKGLCEMCGAVVLENKNVYKQSKMTALTRAAGELEGVWRMHVVREPGTKRDVWKRKVETVVEEAYALRLSLDKFGGREQRRAAEVQERQELMARATGGRAAKGQMDAEAQMASSVGASKRALDEMYETGSQVLVSMAGSRERLKRAHRKVLDVINSVGLGETLLKLIERRHRINVWIMYCGLSLMVVLAVVFVVWR
ncbi:hypothetical protein FOA52_003830 [Chlamydomonas sp. UWO 241]|nr:hypothetical protein FOA52_003830 [Chlamydomonas sp. UWO 241]